MEGMSLQEHFATLEDPRVERTKRNQLLAIITIALCAVVQALLSCDNGSYMTPNGREPW